MSSRVSSKGDQEDFPSYRDSQSEVAVDIPETPPMARRLSAAQILRLKHVPLIKFLTFPAGREAFREFLVREFSVENLLFVEAARELDHPGLTKAECKELFDKFVAESSPNQVNLPMVVVQRLEARLGDSEPGDMLNTVFDDAVNHVMKLMHRDAFKRFQNTSAWQLHVVVFDADPKASPATTVTEEPATPYSVQKVAVVPANLGIEMSSPVTPVPADHAVVPLSVSSPVTPVPADQAVVPLSVVATGISEGQPSAVVLSAPASSVAEPAPESSPASSSASSTPDPEASS
jgi:hypothetical protein